MNSVIETLHPYQVRRFPEPRAALELLKPITWFPPMWAFACGAVSAGVGRTGNVWIVLWGIVVAGPLVCATSQAVNDWFDRHVDAINEPERPIPSGRIPGRWGLWLGVLWTAVSLAAGWFLGPWGFGATALALLLAWAYSMPPVRLKQNGWGGNLAVGLSYEGLAWVTGAAVVLGGGAPPAAVLLLALLYSLGAHGIMTLNDFKSREGDLYMGVNSIPALLGPLGAARTARWAMLLPQFAVVGLLLWWGKGAHGAAVLGLVAVQWWMLNRLVRNPDEKHALWMSALGVPVYVTGMMISAFAVRGGVPW